MVHLVQMTNLHKMNDFPQMDSNEKPQFNYPSCSSKTPFVLSVDSGIKVPATINQYLRDYQRDGVQFLYDAYVLGKGAILADDMGLGKTIQVIAFLSAILHKTGTERDSWVTKPKYLQDLYFEDSKQKRELIRPQKTFLIISPASVLYNWIEEFETWGYFVVGKYHRMERRETILKAKQKKLDVVMTTFETARDHVEELNAIRWDAVIVDECHKIKDPKSRVTKALKSLKVKRRYGLTGTIMQNTMKEMWCLLDWANPGCLGPLNCFDRKFIQIIEKGQQHSAVKRDLAVARKIKEEFSLLHQKFILRRTKQLIRDQLPSKDDQVVYCRLSPLQESVYRSILDSEDVQLVLKQGHPCLCGSKIPRGRCCFKQNSAGKTVKSLTMAYMSLLLKAANHVALLLTLQTQSGTADTKRCLSDADIRAVAFANDADYLSASGEESFKTLSNPKYCGKMKVLVELLKLFGKENDKVLIFSYSTKLLDILEQYVMSVGYEYRRIDGSTRTEKRLELVREFNREDNIFLFLLSTKASGLGLNITGANVVIIFDPNWNPSYDLQAQDRAYRIGQHRNVRVYRLISAGTIEENIYLRQIYKQQLDKVAVGKQNAIRYFDGQQGNKKRHGDLFGLKNMFSLYTGDQCLTTLLLARNTYVEKTVAGHPIQKYMLEESVKEEATGHKSECSSDDESEIDGEDELESQVTGILEFGEDGNRAETFQPSEPTTSSNVRTKTINDIFDECMVLHRHSNQRVVGASKVEDHITKCAITDVFELKQFSQVPASRCDPYEASTDDEETTEPSATIKKKRKSRSKKEPKNSSDPQIFVLPNATVLTGQTPIIHRKQQFEEIAFHFSMTRDSFAKYVTDLTNQERLELLERFYTKEDASLTKVFETLNAQPSIATQLDEVTAATRCKSSGVLGLSGRNSTPRSVKKVIRQHRHGRTNITSNVPVDNDKAGTSGQCPEATSSVDAFAENTAFSDLDRIFFGKTEKKKPPPKRKARDLLDEILLL